MFVNISNVMVACYPNQWIRVAIPLTMIGQELIQNNNIICIFSRKLKYFCSTNTINLNVREVFNVVQPIQSTLLCAQILGSASRKFERCTAFSEML